MKPYFKITIKSSVEYEVETMDGKYTYDMSSDALIRLITEMKHYLENWETT